jgi:hypothetical protein
MAVGEKKMICCIKRQEIGIDNRNRGILFLNIAKNSFCFKSTVSGRCATEQSYGKENL